MTKRDEISLVWSCTLGRKSHLNLAGKILLFPLIVVIAGVYTVLELLFGRSKPR